MLGDLIVARDAQVDATFPDECWDIRSGEEDERDGKVLDKSDVESCLTTELDVGTGQEI